ncbi:hypothetical protein VTL71DRAFT_16293 [Oculimacula yallundae]|uniref:Uncharacterized protein n=1 Tax=Oculimacula yallundae TaxID=86028 RepID=A0ABR4CE29_9HELO
MPRNHGRQGRVAGSGVVMQGVVCVSKIRAGQSSVSAMDGWMDGWMNGMGWDGMGWDVMRYGYGWYALALPSPLDGYAFLIVFVNSMVVPRPSSLVPRLPLSLPRPSWSPGSLLLIRHTPPRLDAQAQFLCSTGFKLRCAAVRCDDVRACVRACGVMDFLMNLAWLWRGRNGASRLRVTDRDGSSIPDKREPSLPSCLLTYLSTSYLATLQHLGGYFVVRFCTSRDFDKDLRKAKQTKWYRPSINEFGLLTPLILPVSCEAGQVCLPNSLEVAKSRHHSIRIV